MVEMVDRSGRTHEAGGGVPRSALFTPEERAAVETAVGAAEAKTSAEIVPVIAGASSRHRRADDIAGVWLAFLAIVVLAIVSPEHQIDGVEAVVAFIIALAIGTFAAEKIRPLKRLFVPLAEMESAVEDAALRAFRTFGVGETAGRTGLLIYVSLFERRAVVLGDSALSGVLAPAEYAAIRDVLIDGLKAGRLPQALVAAIEKAGEFLARKLPRAADDRPEITNSLRVID